MLQVATEEMVQVSKQDATQNSSRGCFKCSTDSVKRLLQMPHRVHQKSAEQSQQKKWYKSQQKKWCKSQQKKWCKSQHKMPHRIHHSMPHRIHQETAPDAIQNSSRVSVAISSGEMVQDSTQDATQNSSQNATQKSSRDCSGCHTEFIKRLQSSLNRRNGTLDINNCLSSAVFSHAPTSHFLTASPSDIRSTLPKKFIVICWVEVRSIKSGKLF
ncbi:uncharacterized protein FA14DRAFT_94237 [Meira miltonrushii]|uniref:Uncharacterized protein n=1 Tax=Meira miltonrushii TaxID=1280837 RepID=A0A316V1W8_9BASI|nr:uncharacterized protein FA14DRAFT_94237 [Meira miltonrushii]PWN31462.1 hypothetical protein FA14DRAFT_94237 [Meira miltonrushii]